MIIIIIIIIMKKQAQISRLVKPVTISTVRAFCGVALHRTLPSSGCAANSKHALQRGQKICKRNSVIAAGSVTRQISFPHVAQAEQGRVQPDSWADWRKSRKLQELKNSLCIFVSGGIGWDLLQERENLEVLQGPEQNMD